MDALLEIKNLQTHFFMAEGIAKAVDSTTFSIRRGQVLGVVGESGCGKSITARSIMRMVRPPGHTVGGEILYARADEDGQSTVVDLLQLSDTGPEMRTIRGGEIAMIFQEPRASLSPVHRIGDQITENILLHQDVTPSEAEGIAIEMLQHVHIPLAEQRMDAFAHQLSGGMCQRVMIAMALSCHPSLLIADEPTTALDVTTEAQILELMQGLQADLDMAIMFITHDLGVVADMADEVAVMYLGKIVERSAAADLFRDPKHPLYDRPAGVAAAHGPEAGVVADDPGRCTGPLQHAQRVPLSSALCGLHAWSLRRDRAPAHHSGRWQRSTLPSVYRTRGQGKPLTCRGTQPSVAIQTAIHCWK